MDVKTINHLLAEGNIDRDDMWPRIVEMESKAHQFRFEFGLDELPTEPGLIIIRGPRQYGKSTWLDTNMRWSAEDFGKASTYYLNGDEIGSADELAEEMKNLYPAYAGDAKVKRLFIDEITAVPEWEKAVKRIIDQGLFKDVLIITTGSKASDLRHGSEKLPGRKGKLPKNEYIFLPISYREFKFNSENVHGDKSWIAYLLTGGSPVACNDICQFERLPEYFIQLVRDWVLGEVVSSGRNRLALTQLLHVIMKYGGSPVGFAKLAREAGLANNTVASGYVEQLSDLLAVMPSWPIETNKQTVLMRKPCKFHFINLAVAIAFHSSSLKYVHEFENLPSEIQGIFIEWLVAQEIWRRSVLMGRANPETISFWASKEHEIDFVTPNLNFIEVKKGQAGPLEFSWFSKIFPKDELTVICNTPFTSKQVTGMTIENFLLSAPTSLAYNE
ncbi:MAG: ATP-binding protein [Deltaproteobacteria bacterium]|nr:ATP-binding protein [Deltaproteobacteria bacterium]